MKAKRVVWNRLTVLLTFLFGLLVALVCFVLSPFIKQLLPVALVLAALSGAGLLVLWWYAWLSTSPSARAGWRAVKCVRKAFYTWSRKQGIAVERVEHLATFEDWDTRTAIYIFFKTNSELQRLRTDGGLEKIEQWYRQQLTDAHYPSEKWCPQFAFDSHENVVTNFQGSYFYRLRA